MTIKELVQKLNRQYDNDYCTIADILDTIREYKEEYGVEGDFDIFITELESEEIERGFYGYEPVNEYTPETVPENVAKANSLFVEVEELDGAIDIGVIVGVKTAEEYEAEYEYYQSLRAFYED